MKRAEGKQTVPENAGAVPHRRLEAYRARLRRVPCRATDFAYAKSGKYDLAQDLVVKNKIVAVAVVRDMIEHSSRECAVAGVKLAELMVAQKVLNRGQNPV
jgi:hypothetical protein